MIKDEFHDFAFVAVMHFKDETIDIKTILHSANCHTKPGDLIIRILNDGSKEVELPE